MTLPRLPRLCIALTLFLFTSLLSHAQEEVQAEESTKPEPYLRVTEDRGRSVSLELAVREFVRCEGNGPKVTLVSVSHIGDKELYRTLQTILDDYEIVLYEAVAPPGTATPSGNTPEEKIANTETALRMVASIAEAHREKHGAYPRDTDEMRTTAAQIDGLASNWLEASLTDAWGNSIVYEPLLDVDGFRVMSYGGDGRPGGEGHDADIELDHTAEVPPLALENDNIQQQLARALGLAFQMNEIDYDRLNWRNSDMDMNQLTAAFQEREIDMGFVETMAGTSFPAAMARMLLNILGALDRMMEGMVSDMVKVMLIEMLGDQQLVDASMTMMGEGFSEVLIDLRNQVTIDDLAAILCDEPHVTSVAIFYGAAHMADFELRLKDQLGYEPAANHWIPAITVDIEASRLQPMQVQRMRVMMRNMVQQQMRQLQRMQNN